jgi:diphthamide synthase subunit DPH2
MSSATTSPCISDARPGQVLGCDFRSVETSSTASIVDIQPENPADLVQPDCFSDLLRSYPIDDAVLLGGCAKTTPSLIIGEESARIELHTGLD